MSESDYVGHTESSSALFCFCLLQTDNKPPVQLLMGHTRSRKYRLIALQSYLQLAAQLPKSQDKTPRWPFGGCWDCRSAVRTWVKGQKLDVYFVTDWGRCRISKGFFNEVAVFVLVGQNKATSWFVWTYFSVEGNKGSWHCVSEKKFQANPLNGAPLEPVSPTILHLEIVVHNENSSLMMPLCWAELN